MRSNQFNIKIVDEAKNEIISVYADNDHFYEALSRAYLTIFDEVIKKRRNEEIPKGKKTACIRLEHTDLRNNDGEFIFPLNSVTFCATDESSTGALELVLNKAMKEFEKIIE